MEIKSNIVTALGKLIVLFSFELLEDFLCVRKDLSVVLQDCC